MVTDLLIGTFAAPRAFEPLHEVAVDDRYPLSFVPATVLERLGIERSRTMELIKPDGSIIVRQLGAVLIEVGDRQTVDDVVFAIEGDRTVLGWRALSGLGLKVDHATQTLVDAGPHPASASQFFGKTAAGCRSETMSALPH